MIQNTYAPEHYVGDGVTTDLAFAFRILAKSDMYVYAKDSDGVVTTLVLDTDYSIDDADVDTDDGGTVVLTVAATWDTQDIWLIRETARTQLVDLVEFGTFPAEVIEKSFDRLTMISQELWYVYRQTLHYPYQSLRVDPEILGDVADVVETETSVAIVFDTELDDANYLITATPNWDTTVYKSGVLTTGFTLNFGTAAPASATVDWRVTQEV